MTKPNSQTKQQYDISKITQEDIDMIINKGDIKSLTLDLAKGIMEDLNAFHNKITDQIEIGNKETGELIQEFLKIYRQEQKKIISMNCRNKDKERQAKLDMIMSIKNKFYN